MAKPHVYIPDRILAAVEELHPGYSRSELVKVGLVHVIARGAEPSPADELRAIMAIEELREHPNRSWLRAARHALHTRSARRFLRVHPPGGKVGS